MLSFKCTFCVLNFATEAECYNHSKKHFPGNCKNCNEMVIEIAGYFYELKLHAHQTLSDLKEKKDVDCVHTDSLQNRSVVLEEPYRDHSEPLINLSFMCETLIKNETVDSDEETMENTVGEVVTNTQDGEAADIKRKRSRKTDKGNDSSEISDKKTTGLKPRDIKNRPDKFYCEICSRSFETLAALTMHMRTHSNEIISKESSFRCEICLKHFATAKTLKSHRIVHVDECPFSCDHCEMKFKRKTKLKAHMDRIHLGVYKKYPCHLCEKIFNTSVALNYHLVGHTDECNFKCSSCDRLFKHKSLLSRHIKIVHMKQHFRRFNCKNCDKVFEKRKLLNQHIIQDHNEELPFKCNVCNRCLSSAYCLKTHLKTHSDTKEFVCTYCGKGFHKIHNLNEHINSHTGNRPYDCKECGKKFKSGNNLRHHLLVHTGEKPCKCKIEGCSASYMYRVDLKRHLYSAHGIYTKKFECQICQKVFPENKLLRKHLERHKEN